MPSSMVVILKERNSFWDNSLALVGIGILGFATIYLTIKFRNKISLPFKPFGFDL